MSLASSPQKLCKVRFQPDHAHLHKEEDTKKALMFCLLIGMLSLSSGLSSYGKSPDFKLDTEDP